jgi:hypothetical protein
VGERRGIRWKVLAPAAAAVVTLAVGSYFYFHHTPKLTDKDTIVLADFTNMTGDTVFDGTLRQGLSVQLEQSPFLSIVSEQQIQQTLRMMDQKPDVKLTAQITREICQRTTSAAFLEGSIAQIGTQYVLILKAVDCSSGESLTSTEAQANERLHRLSKHYRLTVSAGALKMMLPRRPFSSEPFNSTRISPWLTGRWVIPALTLPW